MGQVISGAGRQGLRKPGRSLWEFIFDSPCYGHPLEVLGKGV